MDRFVHFINSLYIQVKIGFFARIPHAFSIFFMQGTGISSITPNRCRIRQEVTILVYNFLRGARLAAHIDIAGAK